MSPLFPERLIVRLAPTEISVGAKRYPCDPAFGAEPWHGALEALKGMSLAPRARATVVLSNHFVRYALVPWSAALSTSAEEEAFLRHHFAKIHGERAKGWLFRASEGRRGEPRLASAIDGELVAAIKQVFAASKAKLVSVQPALMHVFNGARAAVPHPGGAWLVIAEADRACVALHADGAFRAVQNAKGDWRTLLERERFRAPHEGTLPDLVLLAGAAAPGDGDWKFRELAA